MDVWVWITNSALVILNEVKNQLGRRAVPN
jgi:hypothetical protein